MTASSNVRLKPPRRAAVGATVAGLAASFTAPAHAAEALWSYEYSTEKTRNGQQISLATYRKRAGAPRGGEPTMPVLLLLDGSSTSG